MQKKWAGILFVICFGMLFFPKQLAAQRETPETGMGDTINQDDLGDVTDKFQENFFEALAQKAIENYEKAITSLQKCEKIAPGEAAVYFELGKNYQALKDYRNANKNYQKALQKRPEDIAVLTALYKLQLETENYGAAIPLAQQLQVKNPDYQKNLAQLYLHTKNYKMALKMLDQLDQQRGLSHARDSLRQKIYTESGDRQAQAAYLKKSVKEDPDNIQNYTNLIYYYNGSGNLKKASHTADALARAHPESVLPQLGYYPNYLAQNKPEKALKAIQVLLQENNLDPVIKERVVKDLTTFVKKNPKYRTTFVEILGKENGEETQSQQQLGEYYTGADNAEALPKLEKALKNNPTDFKLLRKVLALQVNQKQFEKSLALSQKSLQSYPAQAVLYLLKGTSENGLNQYQAALKSLQNGLSFLIDAPETEIKFYQQLALAHKALGNLQDSKTFQQKAQRLTKTLH